jgi:type I restriction enzyme S subunit
MKNWKKLKICNVVDVRDGTHDSPQYVAEGFPLLTSKNLVNGSLSFDNVNYISKKDYDEINKRSKVDIGDILYSMIGSIGNFAIVDKEPDFAIKNVALFKFNNECINNKFFVHLLKSSNIKKQIENQQRGGTQQFVSLKILRNLEFPLPPLETQKKIAAILDAADEYRQKTKALIEKYDQLAQSLFLEMFGDPVRNEKGLKVVKLKDITLKITDGVHAKPNYTASGVPFISVKDITTGILKFNDCKYISSEDHKIFTKRCAPEYLDILYTKVGATYGRPAIVDTKREFSIYVSVALLKPDHSKVNAYFLKDALANPAVKRQADKSIKGIGVPDLHLNMINEFLIPLPDFKQQELFANRIEAIEQQKQQAQASLQKAEELFNSLLQRAFKGELV